VSPKGEPGPQGDRGQFFQRWRDYGLPEWRIGPLWQAEVEKAKQALAAHREELKRLVKTAKG